MGQALRSMKDELARGTVSRGRVGPVKCGCGNPEAWTRMVQCTRCDSWQHVRCVAPDGSRDATVGNWPGRDGSVADNGAEGAAPMHGCIQCPPVWQSEVWAAWHVCTQCQTGQDEPANTLEMQGHDYQAEARLIFAALTRRYTRLEEWDKAPDLVARAGGCVRLFLEKLAPLGQYSWTHARCKNNWCMEEKCRFCRNQERDGIPRGDELAQPDQTVAELRAEGWGVPEVNSAVEHWLEVERETVNFNDDNQTERERFPWLMQTRAGRALSLLDQLGGAHVGNLGPFPEWEERRWRPVLDCHQLQGEEMVRMQLLGLGFPPEWINRVEALGEVSPEPPLGNPLLALRLLMIDLGVALRRAAVRRVVLHVVTRLHDDDGKELEPCMMLVRTTNGTYQSPRVMLLNQEGAAQGLARALSVATFGLLRVSQRTVNEMPSMEVVRGCSLDGRRGQLETTIALSLPGLGMCLKTSERHGKPMVSPAVAALLEQGDIAFVPLATMGEATQADKWPGVTVEPVQTALPAWPKTTPPNAGPEVGTRITKVLLSAYARGDLALADVNQLETKYSDSEAVRLDIRLGDHRSCPTSVGDGIDLALQRRSWATKDRRGSDRTRDHRTSRYYGDVPGFGREAPQGKRGQQDSHFLWKST